MVLCTCASIGSCPSIAALILQSSYFDLVVWSTDVIALDLDLVLLDLLCVLHLFDPVVWSLDTFALSNGNKTWSNVMSGRPVLCSSYSLVSYRLNFT